MVKPIPDGYHSLTPMLIVENAPGLIQFIKDVFGASERMIVPGPNGTVLHCELVIGDSVVMVADGAPEFPSIPSNIHFYTEDTDAIYARAVEQGSSSEMEPMDMFYGDRSATVRDPWGNRWSIATHIEDIPEEEMDRRMAEMMPPT